MIKVENGTDRIRVFGPRDAGEVVSADEFLRGRGESGFRFELINGELHVSPAPDPCAQNLADRIHWLLRSYRSPEGRGFAEVVTTPRVFLESSPQELDTIPEPDVAAYEQYPPKPVRSYRGVYPALVVEIVTPSSVYKDYVRNYELYTRVPTVFEYWIVDPTKDPARPTLAVHKRTEGGQPFTRSDIEAGGVYESATWPGLKLDLGRVSVE